MGGFHRCKNINFSFRILEIVFGIFLVICLFFGMKDFESYFLPVVEDFAVNEVHDVDGGVELYGTMDKVRDCQFREMLVYVKADDETLPIAADFEFLDPAKDLESRAAMPQQWGPWRIFIPVKYDSANITMFVRHKCHSLYETSSQLNNFDIVRDGDNIRLKDL